MLRLKKISAQNCRGIRSGPDLFFKVGGLILCGDNGSGKSSYVDAIEEVLIGKCSSLDLGIQGLSWKKQGTHIIGKKKNQKPKIQLTLSDGNKDYLIDTSTNIDELPQNLQSFIQSARSTSFILRRNLLLSFINFRPEKRYEQLEFFLKLDQYAHFEEQLQTILSDVITNISRYSQEMDINEQAFCHLFGLPRGSTVAWEVGITQINLELKKHNIALINSSSDLSSKLSMIDKDLSSLKYDDTFKEYTIVSDILVEIQSEELIISSCKKYLETRNRYLKKENELKGHFYAEVLEFGIKWITEDSLNICPLCGGSIKIDEVQQYVSQKLKENEEISQLKLEQQEDRDNFTGLLNLNIQTLNKIKKHPLMGISELLKSNLENSLNIYQKMFQNHQKFVNQDILEHDLGCLITLKFDNSISQLNAEIKSILEKSSDSDNKKYSDLFALKEKILGLQQYLSKIDPIKAKLHQYSIAKGQLEILVAHAETARKKTVQKLMTEISTQADVYFQKIHPSERIGNPKLTIRETVSRSINLSGTFYDEEDDPRGHYSEGHLDSLGLCLFLAIARIHYNQRSDFSLLILDDVLHSVDYSHRLRTAELLFEDFKDHQLIITTHDPMWFEILKSVARKEGIIEKINTYRIADWTIEDGPIFGDHLSTYEWLTSEEGKKALPADRAAKSGRLLEELLQNLCDSLSVSLPYRMKGDYTIDPLWTSFYSKAKRHHTFFAHTGACLNAIDNLRQYRNWVGAHFNAWAQTLTASEATDFTKEVIKFREYVYCSKCNRYVARIPQLDNVWSCKCERLRYSSK